MKVLGLFAVLLLISNNVYAKKSLSFLLEEGIITINLKDGTVYTFDTSKYKIVKRKKQLNIKSYQSRKYPKRIQSYKRKPFRPSRPKAKAFKPRQLVYKIASRKNRLSFLAGFSNNGFQFDENRNDDGSVDILIRQRRIVVLGISYSRLVYKSFSISGLALTTKTFLGGVGYEW